MPRQRSNLGRRSRSANNARKKRLTRTDQKHLDENERSRAKMAQRRAEELPEQREERLKVSRVEARRRRQIHLSQQRKINVQQKLLQIQYLNDQASFDPNGFLCEPEIHCTLLKLERIDNDCPQCNTTKFEGEELSCICKKLEQPEFEQPRESLSLVIETVDDS